MALQLQESRWLVMCIVCCCSDDYVGYMQAVAAAAPNLPFYLYDIDFITGIRCE